MPNESERRPRYRPGVNPAYVPLLADNLLQDENSLKGNLKLSISKDTGMSWKHMTKINYAVKPGELKINCHDPRYRNEFLLLSNNVHSWKNHVHDDHGG
ncbi:Uncharacterised protein [Buttiauxella agrestis]|uniref:Uncharacterized protein n=1 Tax=Buttiauxella agrestis TaxID=82977 RepID=A0A381KR54_9ENTR|nr:Uncharacterised protein [Buttiauxella agrestis]